MLNIFAKVSYFGWELVACFLTILMELLVINLWDSFTILFALF